ncbi:MAG: M48 family metalloprotease [Betaproteobacteria bacterium]|nr:M48 family metalloprotease [Betaproteobacteria bacterium]
MNAKLMWAVPLLVLLAGCAGMPDLKNLPAAIPSGVRGLAPSGAGGSLLTAGISAASSVAEASKDVTEQEEIDLGEQMMMGILGAAPLHNNDRIQRYVNQVGRWVASHSERPNLPWRFAVLESPLVNAGAAAGGQIYITTGLLFRMRSEAELAGALGHEIAHVVLRHHVKLFQRQKLGSAGKQVGAALLESKVKVGGGALGQVAKSYAIELGLETFKTLALTPLDRGEEEQADRMGMVLAARAGYDPFGLPSTIQILQSVIGDQGSTSVLFSTHPTPEARLAALDKSMSSVMERYSGQANLQDRFVSTILGMPVPAATAPAAPAKAPARPPAKAPPKK